MPELAVLAGFLAAAVRIATPLLLAAVGEVVSQRGGTINLGIEGAMLAGALAGAMAATGGSPEAALAAAAAAGLATAALFALVAIGAGADQVITGTAITLGAVGLTGAIFRASFGSAGGGIPLALLEPVALPGLARLPLVGEAFFHQPLPTYLAFLSAPAAWWLLFRTRWGRALRAAGGDAESARAAGVPVRRVRAAAVLLGGLLAGTAGGSLVLAQVGSFAERMTAGRGFVAIAIVVLGRWHPVGAMAAALLFGALQALQYAFQAMGLDLPYQLFLMLPYGLTLLALAGAVGRTRAPGELGKG